MVDNKTLNIRVEFRQVDKGDITKNTCGNMPTAAGLGRNQAHMGRK